MRLIYSWYTKKQGDKFAWRVTEGTPRTTPNAAGSYVDSRVILSGECSTRARASAAAKRGIRSVGPTS